MCYVIIVCGLFSLVQITETRRALKDSESGLEKMAIGHHIQDRGHVVEKKHNKKTGEKELNQDFQNMDECTYIGTMSGLWMANSADTSLRWIKEHNAEDIGQRMNLWTGGEIIESNGETKLTKGDI